MVALAVMILVAVTISATGLTAHLSGPLQQLRLLGNSPEAAKSAASSGSLKQTAGSTTASSADSKTTTASPASTATTKPTAATTTVKQVSPTTTAQTAATTKAATTAITPTTTKPATAPVNGSLAGKVVVIDPGHQSKPDYTTEPLSPGSTIMKARCSAGTAGVATRRAEYVVNLEISLKLRALLESQGCTVYLTRTTHEVNISNIERAQFALSKKPDVFIRLHCNGSTDTSTTGVRTYVADTGDFADQLPAWGRLLSSCQSATTGAKNLGVDVSSRYTGLNWATDIPSFLLEMGFMSNAEEDRNLSDATYQDQICNGIADFIRQMPKL